DLPQAERQAGGEEPHGGRAAPPDHPGGERLLPTLPPALEGSQRLRVVEGLEVDRTEVVLLHEDDATGAGGCSDRRRHPTSLGPMAGDRVDRRARLARLAALVAVVVLAAGALSPSSPAQAQAAPAEASIARLYRAYF